MTIGFMFFGVIWIMIVATTMIVITKAIRRSGNNNGENYPHNQSSKYNTINSHYSQATLQGTKNATSAGGVYNHVNTGNIDSDHNHAYEHKVEPIEEASVHELFEDRKEAYRERKAQMKADLHKSSYSEAEVQEQAQYKPENNSMGRKTAKSGDNGYIPNRSEEKKTCQYCGAINIVPWEWRPGKEEVYSCYFCRQDLV